MSVFESESKVSCEASLCQGIVSGLFYGGIFGVSSNGTSCYLSRLFPDDELRPIIKGISGFSSTYVLSYYESRCHKAASRASAMIGGMMTVAHLYPLLESKFKW